MTARLIESVERHTVSLITSTAGLATQLILGDAHLWPLLVLAAVPGAASAFFNPASTGSFATATTRFAR